MNSIAFLQTAADTTDASTYTFSAQNLGAAAADRYIIVTVHIRKAGATLAVSSVTIGGVAATIVNQDYYATPNVNCVAIAIAKVPSGTTGDIVVVADSTVLRCAIGVWRATGLLSASAYSTGVSKQTAPSTTMNVPFGFAIGVGQSANASATCTWGGLTERYDTLVETFLTITGADQEFAAPETGRTISVTYSAAGEGPLEVLASWEYSSVVKKVAGVATASVKKIIGVTNETAKKIAGVQNV
jgi:hypothetical protein